VGESPHGFESYTLRFFDFFPHFNYNPHQNSSLVHELSTISGGGLLMDFSRLVPDYNPKGKTIIFGDGKRRICYGPVSCVSNGTYGIYLSIKHPQALRPNGISGPIATTVIFVSNKSHILNYPDNSTKIINYTDREHHTKTVILTPTTDQSRIKDLADNLLC